MPYQCSTIFNVTPATRPTGWKTNCSVHSFLSKPMKRYPPRPNDLQISNEMKMLLCESVSGLRSARVSQVFNIFISHCFVVCCHCRPRYTFRLWLYTICSLFLVFFFFFFFIFELRMIKSHVCSHIYYSMVDRIVGFYYSHSLFFNW